jgi:hypothetical protein
MTSAKPHLLSSNVAPPTAQPTSRAMGGGRSPVKSFSASQCFSTRMTHRSGKFTASCTALRNVYCFLYSAPDSLLLPVHRSGTFTASCTALRKVYCFLYSAPESLLLPVQRGPALVKCTTRPHHSMHSIALLILKQLALWGDLHRRTFEALAMLSMPYRSGAKY